MIYKRHLLTFGSKIGYTEGNDYREEEKRFLSMGEDEKEEALPNDTLTLRTWWRKWLKMN